MAFSKQARRMAAALRSMERPVEEPPTSREAVENIEPNLTKDRQLPDSVPLDRRRNVPLGEMSEDELTRALGQARRRLETAKPDVKDRYQSYQDAIEDEMLNRRKRQKKRSIEEADPPPAASQHVLVEELPKDLPAPPNFGEFSEDDIPTASPPTSRPPQDTEIVRAARQAGVDFAPDPGDIPESPLI